MNNTSVYKQSDIELSNGNKFTVWTTIETVHGSINTVDAALDNWLSRTNEYTAQSFVDYVNSKGVHKALTDEQFQSHPGKMQISQN